MEEVSVENQNQNTQKENKAKNIKGILDTSLVNSIDIDVLENSSSPNLYEKLNKPDILIHLAWQDGFNHKANSHLKNLYSHYEFLCNMIDNGCSNITVMGSMHEIGYHIGEINQDTPCNPMSLYGISKNTLRQSILTYIEGKDVSLKWLRAFYITGDDENNNSIFSKIIKMAKDGKKSFPFTDGKNKYDFLDVNILAKQIIKASIQEKINGIINVCSGKSISLKDKVEEFINKNNLDIEPEFGVYPTRKYDSPEIYGNVDLINKIMEQ